MSRHGLIRIALRALSTSRFVNDGALHSVALNFAGPSNPFPAAVGIFVLADGIGDLGRGIAVDNVRISNTLPGMLYCDGATPASCPCSNSGGAFLAFVAAGYHHNRKFTDAADLRGTDAA